jgi:hypothetical protein
MQPTLKEKPRQIPMILEFHHVLHSMRRSWQAKRYAWVFRWLLYWLFVAKWTHTTLHAPFQRVQVWTLMGLPSSHRFVRDMDLHKYNSYLLIYGDVSVTPDDPLPPSAPIRDCVLWYLGLSRIEPDTCTTRCIVAFDKATREYYDLDARPVGPLPHRLRQRILQKHPNYSVPASVCDSVRDGGPHSVSD